MPCLFTAGLYFIVLVLSTFSGNQGSPPRTSIDSMTVHDNIQLLHKYIIMILHFRGNLEIFVYSLKVQFTQHVVYISVCVFVYFLFLWQPSPAWTCTQQSAKSPYS
jgi:hypothetical protein